MKKALFSLVALVVSFLLAPVAGHAYTPTITSTSTISPTHSITPTRTITPNGTLTATPTFSVSPTITQTRTRTPSVTPTLTPTLTATPTPAYADPDLTSPGSGTAGKVMGGADTKLALSMVYTYGLADCGAAGTASPASHTASPINLTHTTGMRPSLAAALPYFGTWTIYVVNTGASNGVAAVRMKSAGVVNEAAGGKLVKPGEGVELHAIARDGLHLWLQGVTQTTTLTYSICVN